MIQDIYPHRFDIAYKHEALPKSDSRVMLFCINKLILRDLEEITFFSYGELKDLLPDSGYTFLFSLDDQEFYRAEISDQQLINVKEKYPDIREADRRYFRSHGPKEEALAAITGMHLNGWYLKNKFCGACGTSLVHDDKERMLKCPKCGNMVYPRINPAVIVGIVRGDEILLTKYNGRSYTNYALVAGFVEIGESFEACVEREVFEETGLRVKNITYYKSQPWGFADDILAGYYCQVDGSDDIIMDQDELSLAKWVKREELPEITEDLSLTNEMINTFRANQVSWK